MSKPMPEGTVDSPQEASESPETDVEALSGTQGPTEESEASEEPQTFDRDYVQGLRDQNAKLRVRSKKTDDLAAALVTAYANETNRLHDPSDLPFSEEMLGEDALPDRQRVSDAVEKLVTAKPHLAKLRVVGDVGQGVQGQSDGMQSLGSMLRTAAR